VVVHAGAKEAGLRVRVRVAGREAGQLVEAFGFRQAVLERQGSGEPQLLGDRCEQLVDGRDPDRLEHRCPVGVGC
jgi:hypothetical protein